MSLTLIPLPSQLALFGSLDEATSSALSNLFAMLAVSDGTVLEEGRKTVAKCESVGTTLMQRFADVIEENRTLRTQLVLARHHEQENKMLDQSIVTAAHEETKIARDEVIAVRHEIQAVRKEMETLIDAKAIEALAARQASEAQLEEAHQQLIATRREIEAMRQQAAQEAAAAKAVQAAAVLAVTQTKAAELATIRQEAEEAHRKAIQDQKVAVETELQRQDTLKLEGMVKRTAELSTCLGSFGTMLTPLIQQRNTRTIHLDTNSEEQQKDTAAMQSIYTQVSARWRGRSVFEVAVALSNLIATRNARL
jgi:hypothetical protein